MFLHINALREKLKLVGGAVKYFLRKLFCFQKIFKTIALQSNILKVCSLDFLFSSKLREVRLFEKNSLLQKFNVSIIMKIFAHELFLLE